MIEPRYVQSNDVPRLASISATGLDPWSEDELRAILKQSGICCRLVTEGGLILGYVIWRTCKRSFRVLSIGVTPSWRRRGVGRFMMRDFLIDRLTSHRRRVEINVSEENLDAQLWLKALGFVATDVVRQSRVGKDGQAVDAYLFEYRVVRSTAKPEDFSECMGK